MTKKKTNIQTNIQIMSVYGNVLFEYSCVDNTLKKTVEKAVKDGASLYGANLNGANLDRANLNGASLDGANLDRANLDRANLNGASLYGANLDRANLNGANLDRANLNGVSLYGASLNGANLDRANLNGASLDGANLDRANLDGAKNLKPIYFSELYNLKLLPKDTRLRMWKYLENGRSPYQKAIYEVGKTYKVKDFNTDEYKQCQKGLNVATLQWCLRDSLNKSGIELIEIEFKISDIVAIPYWTDGKFRVKQFKVLRKIFREEGMDIMYKISGFKKEKNEPK